MFRRVEMRKNGEHRKQEAGEMTAGVSEEDRRSGKVEGQETQQRPDSKKRDGGHQVLVKQRRLHAEEGGGDDSKTGAKAVHVVQEIERIGDCYNPKHGDREAEEYIRNEQCDTHAAGGDQPGNEHLAGEFQYWAQFMPVVEPTE